jgi:hypothetical protein
MKLARVAIAVATLACAATIGAQEIVLYQNDNFSGPRYSANQSVTDLGNAGFNDRASSAQVRGGSWQLCSDAYFRGQCVTLGPGNYPSLGAMGLNDRVSSLREIGWNGGGGNNSGGGSGPASVVLFDGPGMTGRSYTLNQATPDLGGTGFNDRAMSAIVNSGTWQLCVDANYQSSCEIYGPGQHARLEAVGSRVSSARPYYDGGGGGNNNSGSWGGGGGNWGGNTRVVLYEGQNFSGRSYTLGSDVLNNLGNTGFNDRASSMRIERGYWMFCTDANFLGDCRTFGPGDYPSLSWLSNRISSGRRISNDYPYNAPPRWQN